MGGGGWGDDPRTNLTDLKHLKINFKMVLKILQMIFLGVQ